MALSFEQRIRDEYSWLTSNIMLHPYVSVVMALIVGVVLGLFL